MDRVTQEWLDEAIDWQSASSHPYDIKVRRALMELRERRERETAPCPEHAKMVEEWDTYEMGRDDSSAAPYWCQLYKDGILQGQGIGMTMEDAIRQANENK